MSLNHSILEHLMKKKGKTVLMTPGLEAKLNQRFTTRPCLQAHTSDLPTAKEVQVTLNHPLHELNNEFIGIIKELRSEGIKPEQEAFLTHFMLSGSVGIVYPRHSGKTNTLNRFKSKITPGSYLDAIFKYNEGNK